MKALFIINMVITALDPNQRIKCKEIRHQKTSAKTTGISAHRHLKRAALVRKQKVKAELM